MSSGEQHSGSKVLAGPRLLLTAIFCGFAALLPIVSVVAPKGTVVLLLLAAFLAVPTYWWVYRRFPVPDLRIAIAFALLALWCAIASAWSVDTTRSFVLVLRIAVIFAVGMVLFPIAAALDDAARARVGRWLIGGFVLVLILMISEIGLGYPLLRLYDAAEAGNELVWFNRSAIALALIVWPMTAYLWARGFSWQMLAVPVLLSIASVFLESTAATLGLLTGLCTVLLAFCFPRAGFPITIAASVFAFVGMPFAALEMRDHGWHRAGWLPASAQHRVEIWDFSVHRIAEKPVLGWGFDGSRHLGSLYPGPSDSGREIATLPPHNVPLQVLLELGAIGAVISLTFLWLVAMRLDGICGRTRMFGQALFVAALAIGSVAHGAWENWWLALVLSVALLLPLTTAPSEQTYAMVRNRSKNPNP